MKIMLKDIISRWYFDDLRTNKQLGYVVYATQAKVGKTSGIRFMVQSPNTSPKGIMQHNERFFVESLQKLTALSESEFDQFKESLLNKLERKPESLSQEFENFSFDYARGNQQFDRKEKLMVWYSSAKHWARRQKQKMRFHHRGLRKWRMLKNFRKHLK